MQNQRQSMTYNKNEPSVTIRLVQFSACLYAALQYAIISAVINYNNKSLQIINDEHDSYLSYILCSGVLRKIQFRLDKLNNLRQGHIIVSQVYWFVCKLVTVYTAEYSRWV